MNESEGGVFIPTKQLLDRLDRLTECTNRLVLVVENIEKKQEAQDKRFKELEDRQDSTDKWRYGLPIAYLGVLISFVSQYFNIKVSGKS